MDHNLPQNTVSPNDFHMPKKGDHQPLGHSLMSAMYPPDFPIAPKHALPQHNQREVLFSPHSP